MLKTITAHLSRMYAAWTRFWFTPCEPTVLAAIRIVTGVITCYTLFAYSYNLQELIGADAWLDLDLRASLYRYGPVQKFSFDWTDDFYRPWSTPEEKAYAKAYEEKHKRRPPAPYPKTLQEEKQIDDYIAHFGVDPRTLISTGRPLWSIWFHITDPQSMAFVHGFFLVCSFLFTVGLGTRLTGAITWFAVLSYIHRAPASLFGADSMMNILLMYLVIGPSGAALSVDRLIAVWRAKRGGLAVPPLMPSVSANLVIRLIQIHICIIYLSAGLSKLQGGMWWTGTAPWYILANFEYAPMNWPIYIEALRFLTADRLFFEFSTTAFDLGTLVFEITYAFVIWRPSLRKLTLWMAVALHAGIGLFMGLTTFSELMLAFNLAFVAPSSLHWAIDWLLPESWRLQPTPPTKDKPREQTSSPRPELPAKKVVAGMQGKNRR